MNVAHYMTPLPITISPRDTAERAITLMDAAHIDHLVVCEGERLVGLVARAGLLERLGTLIGRQASREQIDGFAPFVHVAGVMTLDPPRISAESPIADAAALMRSRGSSAVAVIDGKNLVGILTGRDLWTSLADGDQAAGAGR